MNVEIILTSSLVAGIVGGLITWFSNHRLQRGTFRNEYYKQLITKRLKAYETVEALNKFLMQTVTMNSGDTYPIMFHSADKFVDSMVLHAKASEDSVWLSHDITDILSTINHLVLLANEKYKLQGASPDHYRKAGIEMFAKIVEVRQDLHNQLRSDFKDLHKIESFIQT